MGKPTNDELEQATRNWIAQDPDPETREELERLAAANDKRGLQERMGTTLPFGTAGLRGLVGAGSARINRAMVARVTSATCAWLALDVPDAAQRGICIGFDARPDSRRFARDAAEVALGAGFDVALFEMEVPTPLLAFAILERRAAAGFMITASHNPPAYNGFKLYWENGAQIIAPHDSEIGKRMAASAGANALPRVSLDEGRAQQRLTDLGEEVFTDYLGALNGVLPQISKREHIRIAYTALHGVGERFTRAALARADFKDVVSVKEQAEPDGTFPTVAFPNPEEPGAMERVLELARNEACDLVLANDPDADRLAVAVRAQDGHIERLSGNEVGCLLADFLLTRGAHEMPAHKQERALIVSSLVSTPLVGAIARSHGAQWEQTLTGFKWICNRAIELEREENLHFVFGFEEALGYTVGTLVRDKDGIGTAALVALMSASCKAQGRTLVAELNRIYQQHGVWLSRQRTVPFEGAEGPARMGRVVARLCLEPPTCLAELEVTALDDVTRAQRRFPDGSTEKLEWPASELVLLHLEGGHRLIVRPSGTEPKLKCYLDVRASVTSSLQEARAAANATADALLRALDDELERLMD